MPRRKQPMKSTGIARSSKPIKARRTEPRRTGSIEADHCIWSVGREAVRVRAEGRCEAGIVCRGAGAHEETHHRKLRRFGDHRPVNLVACCTRCHVHIHANVLESHAHGFLVWSYERPEEVLVIPWQVW